MSEDNPPGVDLDSLRAFLDRERPGMVSGPLTAELIAGGRSNLTYFINDEANSWVLRRPPLGHVLDTAHDMAREFTVISALRGTSVPVAEALVLCEDLDVMDSTFYLMERVAGSVLRDFDDAMAIGPSNVPGLSYRLVDVLGHLHATEPGAVGLSDFGRPDGFLERQIRRWTKQLDSSRSRVVPGIDELASRLRTSLPTTQRAGIVHGDYRLDNVIVHRGDDGYEVAAVVDWEMSTLGDPLTDIGLFCVYWSGLGAATLVPAADVSDPPAPFPSTEAVISTYADSSGLDLEPLPWYIAFGSFKLAVIVEGIHYRHSLGKTVGEGFGGIGDLVQPLVDRGLLSLDQAGM
ncbi:MAG: phosphotransferase family protein [Candidatus Nanopelagicales bacterium]